jgi:hypothetical protein
VISGGENVRAQIEQVVGNLRSYSEAASRIFCIDDDQINVMCRTNVANVFAHDSASRTAEDVADEKNVQLNSRD